MRSIVPLLLLLPAPALADTLVATRTIPARTVVLADQVALVGESVPGAVTDPAAAIGMEARVTIYPGRPIHSQDLAPPARVARNSIVTLEYRSGDLFITTEGRALDRAAEGEVVRVMNLSSRTIITGRVAADGAVRVEP